MLVKEIWDSIEVGDILQVNMGNAVIGDLWKTTTVVRKEELIYLDDLTGEWGSKWMMSKWFAYPVSILPVD